MTWLEKEVPSLELCKKLKEIGYPQDTDGYLWTNARKVWLCGESWEITEDFYLSDEKPYYPLGGIPSTDWWKQKRDEWFSRLILYKAPTVRELFDMLPGFIKIKEAVAFLIIDKDEAFFSYTHNNISDGSPYFDGKLSDRLAKMLIWLKQHGYIDFKKEG